MSYGLDGDQQQAIRIAIDRLEWSNQSLETKRIFVLKQLEGERVEQLERGLFKKRFEQERDRLEQARKENDLAIAQLKGLLE